MTPIFKRFRNRKAAAAAESAGTPAVRNEAAAQTAGAPVAANAQAPQEKPGAAATGEDGRDKAAATAASASDAARPVASSADGALEAGQGAGEKSSGSEAEEHVTVANAPLPDSMAARAEHGEAEESGKAKAGDEAKGSTDGSRKTNREAPTMGPGAMGGEDSVRMSEPAEAARPAHLKTSEDLIAEAFASWHEALEESAGKSPMQADAPGVVDLSHPHPTGGAQLFSGTPTRLTSLVREDRAQRTALKRMEELVRKVEDLSNTYGYAPVTLAIGRLVWSEIPEEIREAIKFGGAYLETGDFQLNLDEQSAAEGAAAMQRAQEAKADPAADSIEVTQMNEPALLQSARLEPDGDGDARITLTARCEVNPVVLRAFRSHSVPSEQISQLRALAANPEHNDEAIARIRELGRLYLPGFSYQVSSLLGSFVHPGSVLLSDLEAMEPYIKGSGIMTALAGDVATRQLSAQPLPPASLEDRSPETERGAGDRDVAELAAVEAVASGRSVVLDVPSGSKPTGTIAAIVADAAATGRSVLFVPGRQSTGRAFVDEMERIGLGDLVLDFSDVDAVAYRLRTGMRQREPELPDAETLALRDQLTAARARLSGYINALHDTDEEWGESVHSLIQHMAALMIAPDAPGSRVRLPEAQTRDLAARREAVTASIREFASLGAFATGEDASPWAGSPIDSAEKGEAALRRAERLAKETVPVIMAQSHRVASEMGLVRARTLVEWLEQITMLDGIAGTLEVFVPRIYERSAQDMVIATASKDWRERTGETMKYSDRRRLAKQAREYLRPGVDVVDLHDSLAKVQSLRDVWRHYCKEGSWPTIPDGLAQIKVSASEVVREIKALQGDLAPGTKLEELPMEEMLDMLRRLGEDTMTMESLPRRNELKAEFEELGYGPVIEDFAKRGIAEDKVDLELELIYCSSVFEQLVGRSEELSRIGSAELSELAAEVRRLDRAHVDTLAGPVLRGAIGKMRQAISARREDTMTLDRQLERYSTGMLADSIANYSGIVQASRPVWVIPAMMVAEFVPPMPWADIVIMDSMDTMPVANAVSMLMRGRQIVVVGDTRRGGENSAVEEFARVLPVLVLPTVRAHHDELATATLRAHGYEDVLEMVPAVRTAEKSRLIVVDGRGVPLPSSGMVEGTQVEVDHVVDAIVEHILTKPEKSLAVVSVSTYHAERIREALKLTVRGSSVLQSYLSSDSREPFTILDITQCAGLRRDSIILTVGFGKTVHGRVLHSFGILAERTGLTGLVDAVEAAREELTIISSLGPGDVNVDTLTTAGPRLLARLIDRAGGIGGRVEPDSNDEAVTPLLGDLASRLEQAGWSTATNYGYDGGLRIPLVAGSPELEGTWRVAVVLDDAEYVAEPSQRRRDRYWLERLEERGWIVYRTFSTSLFIDPVGQSNAIIDLLSSIHDVPKETESAASPALAEGWQDTLREESLQIRKRGKRPDISAGLPLAAYSDDELDELVTWICSDGRRRTEDQLVFALREELDVNRRGSQIDAVLRNVIRRSGRASDDISSALSAQSAGGTSAGVIASIGKEVLGAREPAAENASEQAPEEAQHGQEAEPGAEDATPGGQ